MDILIVFALIVAIAVLVGTILAFVNRSTISTLKSDLHKLTNTVKVQRVQINKLVEIIDSLRSMGAQSTSSNSEQSSSATASGTPEIKETVPVKPENHNDTSIKANSSRAGVQAIPAKDELSSAIETVTPKPVEPAFSLETFLMGNGLLWLGAAVLALGGVFLAKYSIEAGIFPPGLRITMGAIFGIGLVVVAEYLYRNPERFQINSTMISAALASGGLITCFSLTLVAFDFYAFLSPLFAFALLAVISVAATWLSIRFGPILALVGVVGAYVVPALVSTGSNNVFSLLLYVAFISVSTLWVHASVKRSWLWWLSVLGHFAWLFIGVFISEGNYDWVIFVYCLVSIYLFVLLPITGWKFDQSSFAALNIKSLLMPRKEQLGVILPVLSLIMLFINRPFEADILIMLSLFSALLLIAPFRHSAFDTWPFIALFLCVLTFLKIPVVYDYTDNLFPFTAGYLLAQVSAVAFVVYGMFGISLLKDRPSFLLLLVFAPLALMGLSYALSVPEAALYLYSVWSVELMVVAVVFAVLGLKTINLLHKMTFLMLANGALTLTFTMLLSASVLTIAIVSQITLMAYLSHKYRLVLPNWLYKVAIAAVMLRLTAAPWLADYMGESILGVHWSLIVYPVAFTLLWTARLHQQDVTLKAWFTGAMLHLLALFVTTETSFLLVGAYPSLFNLSYEQSILLSMNWLILAGVYLWRRQSTSLKAMYMFFSILLISGSALLHLFLSVLQNPFVVYHSTGTGIFFNWLIPLWLVPALVLISMIYVRLVINKLRPLLLGISCLFIALYINGLIRGIYHPALSFSDFAVGQQELYVYSIVWLVIAIGLIVSAQIYKNESINKAGFSVLAIVILKAFIIDLSNLEGLYRALSFMGLGLSLVGIGWLFQRFKRNTEENVNTPTSADS